MSWSYNKSGKAETVRADAAQQLARCAEVCKSIPAEVASIEGLAKAIDAVCEAAPGQGIKVEAHGSAWRTEAGLKSFVFSAKVDLIDMA